MSIVLCIQEAVLFGWITVCPSPPRPKLKLWLGHGTNLSLFATPPKNWNYGFGHGAIYSKMPTFVYDLIWHLETQSHLNCPFYVVFLRSDLVNFILKTGWLNSEWGRKDFYFLRFLKSRQLMSLAFLTGVIQNNTEWVKDWVSISFHMNFFNVVIVVLWKWKFFLKIEVLFHIPHAPKSLLSQRQWSWNLLKYSVFSRYGEGNFNNIWKQISQKGIDSAFY